MNHQSSIFSKYLLDRITKKFQRFKSEHPPTFQELILLIPTIPNISQNNTLNLQLQNLISNLVQSKFQQDRVLEAATLILEQHQYQKYADHLYPILMYLITSQPQTKPSNKNKASEIFMIIDKHLEFNDELKLVIRYFKMFITTKNIQQQNIQLQNLCLFLSKVEPPTNPQIITIVKQLIKYCLFKFMMVYSNLITPSSTIQDLQKIEVALQNYQNQQIINALLQNIYLLTINSKEIFIDLIEWVRLCFSKKLLHPHISQGNHLLVQLCKILFKVFDTSPTVYPIKNFIKSLKYLPKNSLLVQKIIQLFLSINNHKIIEQQFSELIDFDIRELYPLMYSIMLPYALKSIENIEQNVLLINYIVRIKFAAKDDWNIMIKNEIFSKFFQHICHFLTSENLILLYKNLDENNKDLFDCLINYDSKKNIFPNQQSFIKYLFPVSIIVNVEEDVFLTVIKIMIQLSKKMKIKQKDELQQIITNKLFTCYDNAQSSSLHPTLKMIQYLSYFEKQQIDKKLDYLFSKMVPAVFSTDPSQLHNFSSLFFNLFTNQSNKTTTLTLLRFCFYFLIAIQDGQSVVQKILIDLCQKLQSHTYYRIRCYSRQAFNELLYIYSLQGRSQQFAQTIQYLILVWMNYASTSIIHHIYEISKYQSSSEFLQEKIKELKSLNQKIKCKVKVFSKLDKRLQNFLRLFYKIISDQSLQKSSKDKRNIIYCSTNNVLKLIYKPHQKNNDSSYQILFLLQNNPKVWNPIYLFMHQSNIQYKFLITQGKINAFKKTKQSNKLLFESNFSNASSIVIKIYVDIQKQASVVTINKQEFKISNFMNSSEENTRNKQSQNTEIILQSSDSVIHNVDIMYNIIKQLPFNLNTSNQTLKKFTLNIKEFNPIQIFNAHQFFSLKYLFVFILQLIRNQLSYSLRQMQKILPSLYKIVFYQLNFPSKNQYYGLFTLLQYITIAVIQNFPSFLMQQITDETLKLMIKPNRMVLEYFKQIILNFQIWSLGSFSMQQIVLNIILRVFRQFTSISKLLIEDVCCFNEIAEYINKFYNPSSISKTLKSQQKNQLNLKVQEILTFIIMNSNDQLFSKYISYLVLSDSQLKQTLRNRRKSIGEKKISNNLIQNLILSILQSQHRNSRSQDKNRRQLMMLLLKLKQFGIITQNISNEKKQSILQYILKQCTQKEFTIQVYQNIKLFLKSAPVLIMQKHLDEILLKIENKNKLKFYQTAFICFLSPYLELFSGFSCETKDKILTFLIIFYQTNSNYKPKQKSNSLHIKFFQVSEFVQLFIHLANGAQDEITLRNKSKKLLDIWLKLIPCMTKSIFFNFLYYFRRKAGNNLKILIIPIQNFEAITSTIIDCSIILQYTYECLLVHESLKLQNQQHFYSVVDNLIQDVMYQKQQELYNINPPLQNTKISNNRIISLITKSFQIRGGILMKLILVLFKYLELTNDVQVIKKIRGILIFNIEKSQDLKMLKKSKSAIFKGVELVKKTNITNQFEIMIKKATLIENHNKDLVNNVVGQDIFQGKNQKFDIAQAFLSYIVLKLALFREITKNIEMQSSIDQLLNELSIKFPSINKQFDPENTSLMQTSDYSQFIKTFTQQIADPNRSPDKKSINIPIRKTTSNKSSPISVIKSRHSNRKLFDQVSQIQIMDLKTRFIKQNAPLKAYKILRTQFIYLYLIRNNIAFVDDGDISQQRNQQIILEFKRYVSKQKQIKTLNVNQINILWKQFLDKMQKEDGFLNNKVHKKKPILKMRNLYLPNMVQGVTKPTSDYDYELMKQESFSLQKRHSFLSYSFLKPKLSLIQQCEKPLVQIIPSANILQDHFQSGSFVIFCERVTRRGVYFCKFNFNLNQQYLKFQTDANGRSDKIEYRLGSTKDSIIKGKTKIKQIHFSQIKQIQLRKYNQIMGNSIQIFTFGCKSYFLNFYQVKIVKKLISKLSKKMKQEQLIDSPETVFKQRKYTQKWQAGKISNFDYLMLINIFSGRTFNDPNQYPIFPWVLKDYTSSEVNFNKPQFYRNLGLPIGALNSLKLERYIENSKIQFEGQKYLYGSFMSASMFVFFYLIRIQPFSSLAKQLQGGVFDSADRLFNSIADVWKSVTCESNTSDIKQLIPQFYCVNIFLQNINRLSFGKTQSGELVDDVKLPPWAKNNSNTFISVMRQALQSDIVSSTLHMWIDLVFGNHQYSKQRLSQFHPRYYQQNINFSEVEQNEIDALISQITYFGQFPRKLFLKDHPSKTESIKKPLKLRNIHIQELKSGYVQKIKKSDNLFIISIYDNRQSKSYSVKIPFDGQPKRYEVDRSNIHKQAELILAQHNGYVVYSKNHLSCVFFKRFNITIPFRKSIVSDRFIILCGRDLTILNFEGHVVRAFQNQYAKTAIIVQNILVYLDKNFHLKRVHLLHLELVQTIYIPSYEVYHGQLMGYKVCNYEGYLVCFNRQKFVYISN